MHAPLEPVRWVDGVVRLVDQRLLPGEWKDWDCGTVEEVAEAIETLAVRGAPAIGIAAAYGVALGARNASSPGKVVAAAREAVSRLAATRPTAVNLFYALDRLRPILDRGLEGDACAQALLDEAHAILQEDLDTGQRIAEAGLGVMPVKEKVSVMTHCNAGGLATSGWGTALAPVYLAHARGRRVAVYADETRPLLQGARLTAWEMAKAGIEVTVVVDGAAASVLRRAWWIWSLPERTGLRPTGIRPTRSAPTHWLWPPGKPGCRSISPPPSPPLISPWPGERIFPSRSERPPKCLGKTGNPV